MLVHVDGLKSAAVGEEVATLPRCLRSRAVAPAECSLELAMESLEVGDASVNQRAEQLDGGSHMREHVELYYLQRVGTLRQQHKPGPVVGAAARAGGEDRCAPTQPEALWMVGTPTLRSRAQPKVLRALCALSADSTLVLESLGFGQNRPVGFVVGSAFCCAFNVFNSLFISSIRARVFN